MEAIRTRRENGICGIVKLLWINETKTFMDEEKNHGSNCPLFPHLRISWMSPIMLKFNTMDNYHNLIKSLRTIGYPITLLEYTKMEINVKYVFLILIWYT